MKRHLATTGTVLLLLAGVGTFRAGVAESDDKPAATKELTELIAKVRENEALYRNLAATVTVSRDFQPDPAEGNAAMTRGTFGDGGQSSIRRTDETWRAVTQGDKLSFSSTLVITSSSGKKTSSSCRAVCDGTETVAIDEEHGATVFRRRYEPAQMLPPHCWGLFTLEVNFPLAVYLAGTEAMQSHPKVRRHPVEAGSIFEFSRVETEAAGEERLGDLACVKVRVKRWYYTKDPPAIQILWLAKYRNYHVAQCQSVTMRQGAEVAGPVTRVTKWRELPGGIWLPEVVSERDRGTRQLTLEQAVLNPTLPARFFSLPEIPASLPKFIVGKEGRLEGSPMHGVPVEADRGTTLDSILAKLKVEEARFDRFDVATTENYQHVNPADEMGGGLVKQSRGRDRSVLVGTRMFHLEEKTSETSGGPMHSSVQRQACDGRDTRHLYEFSLTGEGSRRQVNASLLLRDASGVRLFRSHTPVLDDGRTDRTLFEFLKSGSFDRRGEYKMVVTYVCDERIGELHCHKLKCEFSWGGNVGSFSYLWLARDRNLIAVRRESYSPRWAEKLPAAISFIDDLREVGPGLWFPFKTTHLSFRQTARDGLIENHPLLQWRRELSVESLTLEPNVDDALFERLEVPAGTQIHVLDARSNTLGGIRQAHEGNIVIPADTLRAMRQMAPPDDQETTRRKKALDDLIGQPAPDLPRETWLNSKPLTWREFAGKIVVLEFWAGWSNPSDSDLARLAELHKSLQDEKDESRVLIGIHPAGSGRDAVAAKLAEKKVGFPILIESLPAEGRFVWGNLFDKFAVRQLPLTIVVDGEGKIAAHGRLDQMLAKASQLARELEGRKK